MFTFGRAPPKLGVLGRAPPDGDPAGDRTAPPLRAPPLMLPPPPREPPPRPGPQHTYAGMIARAHTDTSTHVRLMAFFLVRLPP
ncbi:MAG: hypothetical protein AB7O38_25735, partial [Pirellulaceae bacterium]